MMENNEKNPLEGTLGGVFDCFYDAYFTVLSADASFYQLLGYTQNEFYQIFQNHLMGVIYVEERNRIIQEVKEQVEKNHVFMYENRWQCKDGTLKWIWISAQLCKKEGGIPYFHCIFHDISKAKEDQEKLRINEKRFQIILSETQDIIFEMDVRKGQVYYSENYEKKFGYQVPLENFPIGMLASDVIHKEDKQILKDAFQSLHKGADSMKCEYRLKYREEGYRWVEVSATVIRDDQGNLLNILGIITDIHDKKKAILASQKEASLDSMTGLLNRKAFFANFAKLLKVKKMMALILIDIDDFKLINDDYGHLKGDHVLLDVAHLLAAIFPKQLLGRYGGDEFIICMHDFARKEEIIDKIEKFLQDLRQEEFTKQRISVSCSIGVSLYPQHGNDFFTLFNKADVAMYHAKHEGKNKYYMFSDSPAFQVKPQRVMRKSFHDEVIEHALEIFMNNAKSEDAVLALLAYIGNIFESDRISIFQNHQRIYVWHRHAMYQIEDQAIDKLTQSLNFYDEKILYYADVAEIHDDHIRTWLQQRKTHAAAFVYYKEHDAHDIFITFEDCHGKRENYGEECYALQIVSELIMLLLLREKQQPNIQEQRLEYIPNWMNLIPQGVLCVYVDAALTFYFANEEMMKMLGYANAQGYRESIHGSLYNGIYVEDRDMVEKSIRSQIDATGTYEIVVRMITYDGSFIWIKQQGKCFKTIDHKEALLSLCTNVTKEKAYQDQLRIYRESSNGGAFVNALDDGYTLLYGNDLFYTIYEIDPENFKQKGNRCIDLVYAKDIAFVKQKIAEAVAAQDKKIAFTFRASSGKGNIKWISLQGSFMQYENQMVMNGFILDVSKEHQMKQGIQHQALLYKMALQKSHTEVWEYDVDKRILYLSEHARAFGLEKEIYDVPTSLFKQDIIHPMSVCSVKKLHDALQKGAQEVACEVLIKDLQGRYRWENIHYHMLYDETKQTVSAIGIGNDVTAVKIEKLRANQKLMIEALENTKHHLLRFCCNLTKNEITYLQSDYIDKHSMKTYEDLLYYQKDKVAGEDDHIRFQQLLHKENLLHEFLQGRHLLSCIYRRKDKQGNLSWVEAFAYLRLDVNGVDICLIGSLQTVEVRRKIEGCIQNSVEMDKGIYHRTTFADIVNTLFVRMPARTAYAFLAIQVDAKKEQEATTIQEELIAYLKLLFTNSAIIGWIDEKTFGIFLCKDVAEEVIRVTMHRIISLLATSQIQNQLTCAVLIDDKTSTFTEIYQYVQDLHKAALEAEDGIKIDNQLGRNLHTVKQRQLPADWDFANFVLQIQAMPTNEAAIRLSLHELQVHYGADQTFLWDMQEDKKIFYAIEDTEETVTAPHMAEKLNFQALSTVLATASQPMYVDEAAVLASLYQDPSYAATSQAYLFMTLKDQAQQIGVLGLYAPRRNTDDKDFLRIINSILVSILMKQRIYRELYQVKYMDLETGLYNGNALHQYTVNLQVDELHSLGIVYLDINGLQEINRMYGNHYGDDLIVKVASILKEHFSLSHIFRYAGDEYMIVVENISFEAFCCKCKEVRSALKQVCDISMGTSWAEKSISWENLINNAEEQLQLEKKKYYQTVGSIAHHKDTHSMQELLDAMEKGYIKMYLQQKVDSATLHVVGAEALVRYEDEQHGLVPPNKFIPYLETTGLIYFLDMFIYEQVHKLLADWRKKGIPLIPISLNFSRVTLLEDDLIKHMNELNDRYQIDRSLIEIEITESMGAIERQTIIEVCTKIIQAGYRLALDDFGSDYSNIAFLSDIHFHTLKFDKGLVDYLIGNTSSRWILESIIDLCRKLDIYNVAEGVELKEQIDILKDLGCTYIQGYYYSKPVPKEVFDTSRNHRDM